MGSWSQILAWSYLAIHAAHLSDGTIILWNYGHADGTTPEVRLYDPRIGQIIDPNLGPLGDFVRDAQGNILHFPNNHNRMFCAGHTIDYRGFLIVGGGHVVPGRERTK